MNNEYLISWTEMVMTHLTAFYLHSPGKRKENNKYSANVASKAMEIETASHQSDLFVQPIVTSSHHRVGWSS
jgi:hypothetical protein